MMHYKNNQFTFICQVLIAFFLITFLTQSYLSKQSNPKISTSTEVINPIYKIAFIKRKVYQVHTSYKDTIFFNIDEIYINTPFSDVIFNSCAPKFTNLISLEGKTQIIMDIFHTYQGKLKIIIEKPNQIRIKE